MSRRPTFIIDQLLPATPRGRQSDQKLKDASYTSEVEPLSARRGRPIGLGRLLAAGAPHCREDHGTARLSWTSAVRLFCFKGPPHGHGSPSAEPEPRPHRPGHHSRSGNSTPPPSPLASRAALPSRLPHPPRFRALALVGRLPSAPANTCLAARASDKPAQKLTSMLLLAYSRAVGMPYLLAQDLLDAGDRLVDG
jgi:hypothetical protein